MGRPSSSDVDVRPRKKHKRNTTSVVDEASELSRPLAGRKRAHRASSTPPPALSPAASPLRARASIPAATTGGPTTTTPSTKAATSEFGNATLQLTFNLPQGHTGPFNVHIDLASLLGLAPPQAATKLPIVAKNLTTVDANSKPFDSAINAFKLFQARGPEAGTGFNSLPAELRNRIYRLLFVGQPFEFQTGKNFARSAAFLRTSKRIHEEGRTVLYGENEFCLQRQHHPRGNFYEADWKEVGYKDVRRFFEMIGPTNISLIRTVKIDFDDGTPSTSPGWTVEQRRFLNDIHLMQALKMLGKHGQLEYFKMGFYGRRWMYMTDRTFLKILQNIKADKVEFGHARFQEAAGRSDLSHYRVSSFYPGKIGSSIMLYLKEHMLRDPLSDPDVAEVLKYRRPRNTPFW